MTVKRNEKEQEVLPLQAILDDQRVYFEHCDRAVFPQNGHVSALELTQAQDLVCRTPVLRDCAQAA
jgi:hypothetical protein